MEEKDKKELNLTDVLFSVWKGICKCCKACCSFLICCLRYFYRHRWISLAFLVAGAALGYGYYKYRTPYRSGFVLNIPVAKASYGVVFTNDMNQYIGKELPDYLSIDKKEADKVKNIAAYYIVDKGMDGNLDFVDYHTRYDSIVNTWSKNRYQVEIYTTDEECVPALKDAIVKKLCSIPALYDPWLTCKTQFENVLQDYRKELNSIDSIEQKLYGQEVYPPSFYSKYNYDKTEYFTGSHIQIFSQDRQFLLTQINKTEKIYVEEVIAGPISSTYPINYYGKAQSLSHCVVIGMIYSLIACAAICLLIENRKKIVAFLEDRQSEE